jgi:LAGLIDADG endonuclease
VVLPDNLNPNWLSGFVAGDGGFFIGIRPVTGQISFRFHVTQHSRDSSLINLFVNFFGCGKVNIRSNTDRCDYYVQDFYKFTIIFFLIFINIFFIILNL